MSKAWPMAPLGEIITQVSRPERVVPDKEYRLLGVRLEGEGPFLRETKLGSQISANSLSQVKAADFIYSRLFAWRGAFGIIREELDGCYVSGEFPTFTVNQNRLVPEFLRYWFCLPSTLEIVAADCTGSTPLTRNRFKERFFLELQIPLPPLPEQQRIVARIEQLAAKIEEARYLSQNSEKEMEILSRGAAEAVFRNLQSCVGLQPLAAVCNSITDGDHNTPQFTENGVRFIFVGNVSAGHLHFENSKRVSESYFKTLKPPRVPERGDILYSAVGATLGIPAVVDSDEPFCFQRHVAIIKPDRKQVDSKFLWHMLRSRTVFEKAWMMTTGSAQPTVPLRAIRELPIPVPSIKEQQRTVAYLNDFQAKTTELRLQQTEVQRELDALLPSIFDKAFKGELL